MRNEVAEDRGRNLREHTRRACGFPRPREKHSGHRSFNDAQILRRSEAGRAARPATPEGGCAPQIRETRLLLACLSPAYLQSEYCQWEFDNGMTKKQSNARVFTSSIFCGIIFAKLH
jgi:hypothetical protein